MASGHTLDRVLGDPVPEVLAAYYTAIDDARMDEAAAAFTPDVLYAIPFAGFQEGHPLNILRGRTELRAHFERRGPQPYTHRLLTCAAEGRECMLEGVTSPTEGGATGTFVTAATFDSDARIERYISFMCRPPATPGPAAKAVAAAVDAAPLVRQYFDAMAAADFDAAARCFSDDVLYSHPPYRHGGLLGSERHAFRSRSELRAALDRRGPTTYTFDVLVCLQRGRFAFFEGTNGNLPDGRTSTFLSSLSLDDHGLIDRYVTFYCEPRLERR